MGKRIHKAWLQARMLYIFCKRFVFPSMLFTAVCCMAIWKFRLTNTLGAIIWLKAISNLAFYFLLKTYRSNEYYFFYNLHVNPNRLYIYTFIADFIIFGILAFLASLNSIA